jgi:error-prone DNA polymerase
LPLQLQFPSAAPRTRRSWCGARTNLGYAALALTDECSVAGVVRAHGEAKKLGTQAAAGIGVRARRLPSGGAGAQHHRLGQSVRVHHAGAARSEKGEYVCSRETSDFALLDECEILLVCRSTRWRATKVPGTRASWGRAEVRARHTWIAAELLLAGDDDL